MQTEILQCSVFSDTLCSKLCAVMYVQKLYSIVRGGTFWTLYNPVSSCEST